MAYRLKLSEETRIHPVFHVSLLKKSVGEQQVASNLPQLSREVDVTAKPSLILDKRVLYKHGAPIIQVLVKWSDLPHVVITVISFLLFLFTVVISILLEVVA